MISEGSYHSNNPEETLAWTEGFATLLKPGDNLFLIGDLGVGKTLMARGICRGLGCKDNVNSPSFVLLKTYYGLITINHCDLYRMGDNADFAQLGLIEILEDKDAINIFEWSERYEFAQILPRWEIRIALGKSENSRFISWRRLSRPNEQKNSIHGIL